MNKKNEEKLELIQKLDFVQGGYQPEDGLFRRGYQPTGEKPSQLKPPNVGSSAVKPTAAQSQSTDNQDK